jgi:nitrogen fixation NifU-like protein
MYSKKVLNNFYKPKNFGEIKNPDAIGKVGNTVCGDMMWVYLKIDKDTIKDIKFKTFGCVAAIATSSMLTQLARGKKIEEALKITDKDIIDSLDGLPPIKHHCSVLANKALRDALKNYAEKDKIPKTTEKKKAAAKKK